MTLLAAQAARDPFAIALLAPERGPLTYAALSEVVRRVGASLAGAGLPSGARVALICSNGPHMASAFLGIASHLACAPLNPAYRESEFEFFLCDLAPLAVVIERGLDTAARAVAARLGIPVLDLTHEPAGAAGDIEISGASADSSAVYSPQPTDIALLLHTSGTTSRPKLVPLTHANLCASAGHIAESLQLGPADRCLNVMPLFHIHGLVAAVLASLARGASVVCCPGPVAPKFFDWVAEFRPTWYTAVPTIHQAVLARAQSNPDAVARHSFRFIRSCSSALAPSLMETMETTFQVPVVEAYGMTEAAHQMAMNPLPPGKRKPGSVGVAAGPEIAVMDDSGRLLPAGVAGEVVIRGPNVTPGYAANPQANAQAFANGWFRTGDDGYLDADGYLFLIARRKEIINRGGEKIAPREVDEVLLLHPAVEQAVAFAVPHTALGETIAAAVVVKAGRTVSERELREFALARLADFKTPERIVFVDQIPKGPSGKVQRIGLAQRLGVEAIAPPASPRAEYAAPQSPMQTRIAGLFAATLGIERAGMNDNFFDFGGDSALTTLLMVRIEEATGVGVPLLEFLDDPTPAGVCRSLDAPRQLRPPRESGTDAPLRVVIRSVPGEPGLFCLPGSGPGGGEMTGFFNLSRRLGTEQAVTAFRLPASQPGIYTIEDLAARYVEEVLDAQPEGPYHLAGLCTGGFVAWEMARQLAAKGRTVHTLALLDCYNHAWARNVGLVRGFGYRLDLVGRRFLYQIAELRKAGWAGAPAHLRRKTADTLRVSRYRWSESMHRLFAAAGFEPPRFRDPVRLAIRLAAARYVPQRWEGPVRLYRATEPRVDGYDYPEMGWQGLAPEISIHDVPGSHMTMLAEPQVSMIAAGLVETLRVAALAMRAP